MTMPYVLASMILMPLLGAVTASFVPRERPEWARLHAMGFAILVLAASVALWASFDASKAGYQFELARDWIPGIGAVLHIGVDGLSLPLAVLTALLTLVAIIASSKIGDFVREYFTLILLLEAGLVGVFISLDMIMFYLFWEVVLIPMFFLINVWGGPNRRYAAVKFFVYTLAGSLAMLGAIIGLYVYTGAKTFDMPVLAQLAGGLTPGVQTALFIAIAFALAIKVPIVPFHTWLPDAHVEAPTAVSVLLAGVLLKMGSYGFLRFGPQLLPAGFHALTPLIAVLAVVSIVYGAAMALVQTDLKRLVAFSSVSHMGYVMLGIASATVIGMTGAVVQMVSHGLIAALLFLLVGALYERAHTREISAFGGIAKVAPLLAGTLVFASFASLGLPGGSGFIAEFLVMLGAFSGFTAHTVIAALAVMLTAAYLLWMLRRVAFGALNDERAAMPEMTLTEGLALAPLCIAVLVVGVFPQTLVGMMQTTVTGIAHLLGG
jgi:NADH-quinone oxidoreductase subunit M